MNKLKILALDIANKTGWKSPNANGVWILKSMKDESGGMRLIRFRNKLNEIIKLESINLVAYERVSGRNTHAVSSCSELVGVMKAVCEEMKIEYLALSATEIKKFATGKGNASKQMMINSACDKLNYQGESDDEADALWIYELIKERFNQ